MPKVFIAALETDRELAQQLVVKLNAAYLSHPRLVASADALLVLVNQPDFESDTSFRQIIEAGLERTDLLMIVVLVNEVELLPATALPIELQALAYSPTAQLRTDENLDRDVRRLDQQVKAFFARKERSDHTTKGRFPWNLFIFGSLLAVALILVVVANPKIQSVPNTASTDIILIGVAAPFESDDTTDLLLEGINQAIADRPVEIDGQILEVDLLMQDTRCSSRGGLQAARLFTADPSLVGVIGHMCNISCQSAASIYDEADFTTISPGCDAPALTTSGFTSFNRVIPSQASTAAAAAQFVYGTLGFERVVVVHDEQIVGGQLANAFTERFSELGGEVTDLISIESMSLSMTQLVDQINRRDPQLVYYAGRTSTAANLKSELPDVPFVLGDIVDAGEYRDAVGEAAEQTFIFVRRPPEDAARVYGYDAAMMVLDTLTATGTVTNDGGLEFDRKLLRDYVRAYNGCDGRGDCAVAAVDVIVIENQQMKPYVDE